MTAISIQQKLQRGRKLLGKAGDDPDLLGTALGSIHGALEDACRNWLSSPELRSQHQVDVSNKAQASWKVLLELMQRHCGWSSQDVKYVGKMNYLRNQTAHGDEFEGTRQDVEQYLNYVEQAIAQGGTFSSSNSSQETNRRTRSSQPFDRAKQYSNQRTNRQTSSKQPFYQSKQFKSFLASKYSFPILWLLGTFFGFPLGALAANTLAEFLGVTTSVAEAQSELYDVLSSFILFGTGGLGIGFLQSLLLKNKMAQSWQWIVATTIGYASPLVPIYTLGKLGFGQLYLALGNASIIIKVIFMLITFALYGAIIGYWQWLVLRQHFRRADRWIIASAICHGFGFFLLNGLAGFVLPWIIRGGKSNNRGS